MKKMKNRIRWWGHVYSFRRSPRKNLRYFLGVMVVSLFGGCYFGPCNINKRKGSNLEVARFEFRFDQKRKGWVQKKEDFLRDEVKRCHFRQKANGSTVSLEKKWDFFISGQGVAYALGMIGGHALCLMKKESGMLEGGLPASRFETGEFKKKQFPSSCPFLRLPFPDGVVWAVRICKKSAGLMKEDIKKRREIVETWENYFGGTIEIKYLPPKEHMGNCIKDGKEAVFEVKLINPALWMRCLSLGLKKGEGFKEDFLRSVRQIGSQAGGKSFIGSFLRVIESLVEGNPFSRTEECVGYKREAIKVFDRVLTVKERMRISSALIAMALSGGKGDFGDWVGCSWPGRSFIVESAQGLFSLVGMHFVDGAEKSFVAIRKILQKLLELRMSKKFPEALEGLSENEFFEKAPKFLGDDQGDDFGAWNATGFGLEWCDLLKKSLNREKERHVCRVPKKDYRVFGFPKDFYSPLFKFGSKKCSLAVEHLPGGGRLSISPLGFYFSPAGKDMVCFRGFQVKVY